MLPYLYATYVSTDGLNSPSLALARFGFESQLDMFEWHFACAYVVVVLVSFVYGLMFIAKTMTSPVGRRGVGKSEREIGAGSF